MIDVVNWGGAKTSQRQLPRWMTRRKSRRQNAGKSRNFVVTRRQILSTRRSRV